MPTLKLQLKNVYGNKCIYPSCEISKKIAELIGAKTLSCGHVKILKELGYGFELVTPISLEMVGAI